MIPGSIAASSRQPSARRRIPPYSVAAFLQWSFDVLEVDMPNGYQLLCTRLEGVRVLLHIDRERFSVYFKQGAAHIDEHPTRQPGERAPDVTTSSDTILAVIDGKLTLQEAVLNEDLVVIAPLEQLHRLLEALTLYVQCGVRTSGFPSILDSFRSFHRYRTAANQESPPNP